MTPTPTEQVHSPHLLRRFLAVIFGLALVGGLTTACSSDDSDSDNTSGNASDDSYYPHTMTTPHGDVTIEKKPEKILALNVTVADQLLSLGITPTVVSANPVGLDSMPWMKDRIKDISNPDIQGTDGYNIEEIASIDPDIIIGMPYQFQDKSRFDQFNEVAPTVFANSLDTRVDWKDSFLTTAEAVNETSAAQDAITDIGSNYRAAGQKINGIEGKTYSFTSFTMKSMGYGDGSVFEMFGMTPSGKQDDRTQRHISLENFSQIDADLVAIFAPSEEDKDKLESLEQFKNLRAQEDGVILLVDTPMAQAINSPAPGALNWLLDQVTPYVEELGEK